VFAFEFDEVALFPLAVLRLLNLRSYGVRFCNCSRRAPESERPVQYLRMAVDAGHPLAFAALRRPKLLGTPSWRQEPFRRATDRDADRFDGESELACTQPRAPHATKCPARSGVAAHRPRRTKSSKNQHGKCLLRVW
jgi:hypothetical protein